MHTQSASRVCGKDSDGAEADKPQCLALDFRPDELPLALFDKLAHVCAAAFKRLAPVDPGGDFARGEEKGADDKLRNGVGVCAGGVEYDYAFIGAGVDGDIVGSRARPRDGKHVRGDVDFMHGRGTHDNGVGVVDARSAVIFGGVEIGEAVSGDFI